MREISSTELMQRVVYAMLTPAVHFARVFGVSLKTITQWLQMAYFHQLRQQGLTLQEICERLEISMRSAARLSSQLKTNFLEPEAAHRLPRRIEFMLWAEPLSEARLRQLLPEASEAELREALELLLREGRVVERAGRTVMYRTAQSSDRLVRASWLSRIGGLNSLLSTVVNAVYMRFFGATEQPAFARNLSLRVCPEDLPKLADLYEQGVWERMKALDQAALDRNDAIPLTMAICWAPYEWLSTAEVDQADEE